MAAVPTTPEKNAGDRTLVTPGLTRATSVRSPRTPETPTFPQTPTPAAAPGKGWLKPSLKQRANAAGEGGKLAEDFDIEIPPWDRTAELVWIRRDTTSDDILWNDELSFQENSVRMAASNAILRPPVQLDKGFPSIKDSKRSPLLPPTPESPSRRQRKDIAGKDNGRYFTLPDRVRHKIAKLIVLSHCSEKPVRLNNPVFLKPIWPVNGPPGRRNPPAWTAEYFDSLDSVLRALEPYLSVCFALRIDILTAMFLVRRFHVVYSPLVKPLTSPLATKYLDKYGVYMKWINLEVDLSNLAGHWHPASADLTFGLQTLRSHVERFVECQLGRHGGTTLQSLIIMVRRYHGVRQPSKRVILEEKGTERDIHDSLSSPISKSYTRTSQISAASRESEGKRYPIFTYAIPPERKMGRVVTNHHIEEQTKGKGLMEKEDKVNAEVTETMVDLEKQLTQSSVSSLSTPISGTPFCPDENLHVLDPLKRLGLAGLIDNLCLVGASKRYTSEFIEAFLTREQMADRQERQRFCKFRNPPRAYPLTPGQRSAIGRNNAIQILVHETDPQKWVGLFDCVPTEHWKKYDLGSFNFKPEPFKALRLEESTQFSDSPIRQDHDTFKGHTRHFSSTGRLSRRRRSANSLISFITQSSSLNGRPRSGSRLGSGKRSFSGSSIPSLVPESPRRGSISTFSPLAVVQPQVDRKRKYKAITKRRSFIFPSRIPILSHRHTRSPPEFRSTVGVQRTPIALPYDRGHLVSGNRPVSGHRFGLARMMDSLRRRVDEARAGANHGDASGGGLGCSGFNLRAHKAHDSSRSFSDPPLYTRPASSSDTIPGPVSASTRPIALGRSASTSTTQTSRPLTSRVTRAASLTTRRNIRTGSLSSSTGSGATTGVARVSLLPRGGGPSIRSEWLYARNGRNLKSVASERGILRPGGSSSNGTLRFAASERETLKGKEREWVVSPATTAVAREAGRRATVSSGTDVHSSFTKSNSTESRQAYITGKGSRGGAA